MASDRTLAAPDRSNAETKAFRDCFADTYGPVQAYVRRRVADTATVDDVVGEVFLVAWRRWGELAAMEPKLPWLYRVAGNTIRNSHRSDNRRLRLVSRIGSQAEAATATTIDPADAIGNPVIDALATLSDDDQEILRLVAWEELSHAETATALDITVEAVSSRLRRARDRLATALETAGQHVDAHPPTDTNGTIPFPSTSTGA